MKKGIFALMLTFCTVACGGGQTQTSTPALPTQTSVATPGLQGQWEIVFTSTDGNPGGLMEVDLWTGYSLPPPPFPGQKYSAIYVASYLISDNTLTTVGGACGISNIGTASASGNDVQFTLSSGKASGTGTGTYNNAVIAGTYTIPAPCTDKGTFVATSVTTGMVGSSYNGNVLFTDGTNDSMTLDFGTQQSPPNVFSFFATSLQISGTDNYSSNNPNGGAGGYLVGASFTLSAILVADNNPNNIVDVQYMGFQVTKGNAAFFPMAAVGDLVLYEEEPATSCSPFQPPSTCSPPAPFVGTLAPQ